ncbi:hypothetical protein ARMGADRAFT_1082950 [Armillaria gallica]|uniref:F-box domain-containing protein n=1 Tax=Armillaria gallica TaxID=47427 RepID=A0A2H3D8G2_ARMGA|nr:hypothetical protein ARMGADRAFT_1082950 [Armillaria gallica]
MSVEERRPNAFLDFLRAVEVERNYPKMSEESSSKPPAFEKWLYITPMILVNCGFLIISPIWRHVYGPNIVFAHYIHLPNLRRLFVSSSHLLSYLHLPSLDDLMICAGNASDMDGVVLMMNEFVHHSRCTLTSLAIHNAVIFHQVFIKDCLLLMDSLVSLDISRFWDEEVGVLFDALASIKLLPNLRHLSLWIPYAMCSLWDPLTALISSRGRYFRSIRISCGLSGDVDRINEHLALLRPPGLSVVVSMKDMNYDAISCFGKFECA